MTSAREVTPASEDGGLVDIIIPVHTRLELVKRCIDSVLSSHNTLLGDVLVVDDRSPDPDTSAYLADLAVAGKIVLQVNEQNQGFVRSVNNAANVNLGRDFIILNSDTEVANNWLDRLVYHARNADPDQKIATVTPFSNNATIASFPVMGIENALAEDSSVESLDRVFAVANAGASAPLPTGVGFCMFIARAAWSEVGGFDLRYGLGYGEEVDLCCALAKLGWRHLLATDVFVYHEGGASFGNGADQLKLEAQKVVDELYPEYASEVADWVKTDPALPFRLNVELERLILGGAHRVLLISHSMGGGVQQHIDELTALLHESGQGEVFLLSPVGTDGVQLKWLRSGTHLQWVFASSDGASSVVEICQALQFSRVHFHHFKGLPQWVLQMPGALGLPYDVTVHDFHMACPQISFLDEEERYCGRPDVEGCRTCVKQRPDQWGLGVDEWRRQFGDLLADAARVICPSPAVAGIMAEYFPRIETQVWPHPDLESAQYTAHLQRSLTCRKVALVGTLSRLKGLELLEATAALAERRGAELHFRVIGATTEPLQPTTGDSVSIYGQFDRHSLPNILASERPDAFLLLSRVPETFSYALSMAMATGLPVIGLDNGAIGERLANYDNGTLLRADASADEVLAAVEQVVSAYESAKPGPQPWHSDTDPAEYLQAYTGGFGAANPRLAIPAGKVARLVEVMRVQIDVGAREYPIEQVLRAGIDCHQTESLVQLKRQAIANERDLQVAQRHLDIRGSEVDHLKSVIDALKSANRTHASQLEARIAEQALVMDEREQALVAMERVLAERAEHIHQLDGELEERTTALAQTRQELESVSAHRNDLLTVEAQLRHDIDNLSEKVDGWKAEAERVSAYLAEREQFIKSLAGQLREIQESLLWRMLAPVRYLIRKARRLLTTLLAPLVKARRLLTFVRYHYAVGGISGLKTAVLRRLSRRPGQPIIEQQHTPSAMATTAPLEPGERVQLHTSDSPVVSILIPTYGQHEVTANCLRSIAANPPSVTYEVVVMDDAFDEPLSVDALGIGGVRVIRNDENQGFLLSCNRGVAETRGDYVLLLNNDTLVHPGAIDALYATFNQFESVGAVGAKLLFGDGVLQEAGGIVWRDGSAWNWGRNEDASDPRFNYVRSADYCSAAALLVSRAVWNELGGFDEAFAPAYYEDTDLCFSIRAAGYRVLYQPKAVVTHLEGVSHGTDTSEGMKAHQIANAGTFIAKWQDVLTAHRPNGTQPMLERDRDAAARILWVEACVLTPDQDSGSLRTLRLLKILIRMGCKVTFVADNLQNHQPYVGQLQAEGIEVLHAPQVKSVAGYLKDFGGDYDVITLCRHYIAIKYVDLIRANCSSAQIWFDTIDLHYLRLRRQYALDKKAATKSLADLAYGEEMEVINKSDITIVVSDVEVAEIAHEAPSAKVAVVSNIHEIHEGEVSREGREHIMFVGGFQHPPNIDAVEYFAEQIWPAFRERHPDTKALIIGSKMPESLREYGQERGLEMVGFVEDLTPYYQNCVMAIAPLRYGAGVKGKVNQALSFGLPVVGTAAAVEGMGLVHGEEVMRADTPEEFVNSMDAVMNDSDLWQTLSERGCASLARAFSTDVAERALSDMLAEVLRGKP